ncbi:MAG: hypothetical protein KGZ33_03495 [Alkaliphilus sp.]|nr:hypothetical protein [Alkaliphilus sp.]
MVFSLSLVIPIFVVAVIFLIIAGSKGESKEGGEQVIRNVYIYLVLFATLMMVIGGSVAAFMAATDLISPVSYQQSFEEFKRWGVEQKIAGEEELSEAEIKERYDEMVLAEKERQVERAKNSLVKSFGWIIIPLPIFLYFKRWLSKGVV